MSAARALLDSLGRPGDIRLGTARPDMLARLSTGLPLLDEALGGGLPRGRITELAGRRSTGRTGLACAIAAYATAAGETIAWIDPADALDPDGAAKTGIELSRTLWVRPRSTGDALRAAEIVLGAGGFGLVVLDLADVPAAAPRRFPWTTWMRIARTVEGSETAALLVGGERIARSAGGVTIALVSVSPTWRGLTPRARLFTGLEVTPRVVGGRRVEGGRA